MSEERPVTTPEMVEAAARSARARVTYANLEPSDPGYPLVEGGFWGDFMRSLEARWESVREEANTYSNNDAEGQTTLL